MQTLADMGRIFDDEDEAKMVKLTEDLTAWINKYAPTMDDPEPLLLEVASSLVTDEMAKEDILEKEVAEVATTPEQQLPPPSIMITFSFSDNDEWFSFE